MTKSFLQASLVFFMMTMVTSIASARVKLIRLDELPQMADCVIEGTVTQKTARWDAKGVMINTHYIIDVQTAIVGNVPGTVELSFAGGTAEGKTIIVTHTPELEIGQTYILFIYQNNTYSVPTVGHEQGIFKVIRDALHKQDFIVDYNGYQLERTTTRQKMVRGRLTRIDQNGALVQRQVPEQAPLPRIKPIVRDAKGNIIVQDASAYAPRKRREPSVPVTRSEFIRYIQTQNRRTTGAKK